MKTYRSVLSLTSIEDYVCQHAANNPSKTAIVCGDKIITYQQLWMSVVKERNMMLSQGYVQGSLYIFRASQTSDFIVRYLAAHLVGAAAVPLGEFMTDYEIHDIENRFDSIKLCYEEGNDENIADVLFTTGSTGKQKGVMTSYRAIMSDAANLITEQGFTSETVFVICGPLSHIGSLSKIWPVLVAGGTIIVLEGIKDMNAFFNAFNYPSNMMATFMVPAAIRVMMQMGKNNLQRLKGKIDFIETGGAAITQTDMEALCHMFPNARLYNTYASTEAGIITTYDYNHNECKTGCLGKPMLTSTLFICDDGTIACGGGTLMSGYLADKKLTATVLRDGMVFTNDIGIIDNENRLHLVGRNDDIINIGGYKISPLEIESVAMTHPSVADCVCCRAQSPIFGTTVKFYYVVAPGMTLSKRDLALFMANRLEKYKIPRIFEQVQSVKRLFNGKLDRKFYNDL